MTKTENTALQMIAEAARCPEYGPDMVKALMEKLDMVFFKNWSISMYRSCYQPRQQQMN